MTANDLYSQLGLFSGENVDFLGSIGDFNTFLPDKLPPTEQQK